MKQLSLFPEDHTDPRSPISTNWNLWHGCTKTSTGCLHCYMYRPCCYANLTLQKGYHNDLSYWICTGCGEMLINPEVELNSSINWKNEKG